MTSSLYTQAGQKSPWDEVERMYVRTRGPLPVRSTRVSGRFTSLAGLVQDVRKQVGGLPLTFVLHNWGEPETARFLLDLEPVVAAKDSVWLVSSRGQTSLEAPKIGRLLDPRNERDSSMYQMMIGDVVFFSGRQLDYKQVQSWRMRARTLVVQEKEDFSEEICAISVVMTRETYLRSEKGTLRQA